MKEIIIDIDPLGRPTIEGKGFTGKECDAAMAAIEEVYAVPGAACQIKRTDKPEYRRVNQQTQGTENKQKLG